MPGEWFEWEWDETLFAGAAAFYDRGRLPNAPGLVDAFEKALGLDGRGRLLDVGCGPGTVTLPLAGLFQEVVGLDADGGMIRERRSGWRAERGVMNARWVQGRAEDLPADLGTFGLVTFAASFHWMDRPLVAGIIRRMLEPDGAVVHVDNRHQRGLAVGDAFPAPPVERIAELRRAYLGQNRRAGRGIRNSSPGDEAAVFRAAGFAGPELVIVPDSRTIVRSADDLVAETFSRPSTAPHLFGDRLSQFEADVRRVLAESSPDGGAFAEFCLLDNELKIWRVAADQRSGRGDRVDDGDRCVDLLGAGVDVRRTRWGGRGPRGRAAGTHRRHHRRLWVQVDGLHACHAVAERRRRCVGTTAGVGKSGALVAATTPADGSENEKSGPLMLSAPARVATSITRPTFVVAEVFESDSVAV